MRPDPSDARSGRDALDPRRVVAEGYDRIADRYAEWSTSDVVDPARERNVSMLLHRLPVGARVLELGCGGGGPSTQQLAERFALTGVDLSLRQVELSRARIPGAEFIHADATRLDLPAASVSGVVALYVFNHLPHGELPGLLDRIATWLRPEGLLLATLSVRENRGFYDADWLGAPTYFSGYSRE